jgi:hypothetical protein
MARNIYIKIPKGPQTQNVMNTSIKESTKAGKKKQEIQKGMLHN